MNLKYSSVIMLIGHISLEEKVHWPVQGKEETQIIKLNILLGGLWEIVFQL